MKPENVVPLSSLERLAQTHPELEIWWDSSPLIYSHWREELLQKENAPDERAILEAQLSRIYIEGDSASSLFVGVTTNPPLTKQVLETYPEEWNSWTDELIRQHPNASKRELAWILYSTVVKRGAEKFLDKFQATGHKRGYLSGQVDPRFLTDVREMVRMAISLNQLSPNIMVKMPGTKEGIFGITLLTSLGIPTNATLVFTLPQILAVAEAVKEGLEIAHKNAVDLSRWRSVITMMLGRFEDAKEFARQARERGIELTEELKRWSGIAVFKKAYKIIRQRGYPSKLLAASMRIGPTVNNKTRIWHLEKISGGAIVMTIFPNVIEAFLKNYQNEEIVPQIEEEVPQEVLDILMRIPYFQQAYLEEGLSPEEFINYPSTQETAESFSAAIEDLENYVEERRRGI